MVRVTKKIVFVASGLALGLFYQSCGAGFSRLATSLNPGSPADNSLDEAKKSLQEMAARTPDSPEDRAFMALLSDSVATTITNQGTNSCGCPGAARSTPDADSLSESALNLDDANAEGSQKVGATCDRVRGLANRFVPGDGGCWLRANAVCIGGIAQGLDIGKVWIVGDVRDSGGGVWNFHVANVYDGLVYDVGFGLKGITLEQWQQKFSADVNDTKLIVTNCASVFEQDGVKEYEKYGDNIIEQICTASGDHGGEAFYRQMSSWMPDAAARIPGNVVPVGAQCEDIFAKVDHSFDEMTKTEVPSFVAQPGVTAECQKMTFYRALSALSDHQKYTFRSSRIKSAGTFGHKLSYSFLGPFNSSKTVEVIIDRQCKVRAVL
jgi:hypothetical protein